MKNFTLLLGLMKSMLKRNMSIYDFEVQTIDGKTVNLKEYSNKVVLVVNVASYCKFTSQYKDLEALYQKYKDQGFVVLGFPCNQFFNQEPKSNEEILSFCSLQYGVSFPIFSKIDVNGSSSHALFMFLKESCKGFLGTSSIKWNFTKFLINKKGTPVKRFSSIIQPYSMEAHIQELLND